MISYPEICQSEHRSTLRKIMKVRVLLPTADHTFLPKNVLHRNVQGDMDQLVGGLRLQFPQKPAIVAWHEVPILN